MFVLLTIFSYGNVDFGWDALKSRAEVLSGPLGPHVSLNRNRTEKERCTKRVVNRIHPTMLVLTVHEVVIWHGLIL